MTRLLPSTVLKGRMKKPLQEVPREGTRLRKIHDLLRNHPGYAVNLAGIYPTPSKLRRALDQLELYYCMDIRCIRAHGKGNQGKSGLHFLAGEWHGKDYVDYVAARLPEIETP